MFIKHGIFCAGALLSLKFPLLFYPVCLNTYPTGSVAELVSYFAIVFASIAWGQRWGFVLLQLSVPTLLLLRGSQGFYSVDHALFIVVSALVIWLRSPIIHGLWCIYVYLVIHRVYGKKSALTNVQYF